MCRLRMGVVTTLRYCIVRPINTHSYTQMRTTFFCLLVMTILGSTNLGCMQSDDNDWITLEIYPNKTPPESSIKVTRVAHNDTMMTVEAIIHNRNRVIIREYPGYYGEYWDKGSTGSVDQYYAETDGAMYDSVYAAHGAKTTRTFYGYEHFRRYRPGELDYEFVADSVGLQQE